MSDAGAPRRRPLRVALVSARAARGLDEDMEPLAAALTSRGFAPEILDWDDSSVPWRRYALALLRSTWDYTDRYAQFRRWLVRVSSLTRLYNPQPLVEWNTDKHYLKDLSTWGLPTVPSAFIEPVEEPRAALEAFVARQRCAEFVVKPAIGAGARGARRHGCEQIEAAEAHAQDLLSCGRSVLLQPYLPGVDRDGETALIYFGGRFSHAVRKGALLRPRQRPTRELFAPEDITARTPEAAERALAERVLAVIGQCGPSKGPPLYARIDLLRDRTGEPQVLELELAEPSLFLAFGADAAERLAGEVAGRIQS